MVNPAIQNDFSYYRRTLNRMKLSKKDLNISIRDELANRMSLFFAYPTPMMNVINETTVKFLTQVDGACLQVELNTHNHRVERRKRAARERHHGPWDYGQCVSRDGGQEEVCRYCLSFAHFGNVADMHAQVSI